MSVSTCSSFLFGKARIFSLCLAAAMLLASSFISSVCAEEMDTAYVPVIVFNVDAAVKAHLVKDGNIVSESIVEISVKANTEDTLKILLKKDEGNSVMQRHQNAPGNAPVITNNRRGKISLSLPAQIYNTAELTLHSINGKQILRAKVNPTETHGNISRRSLASGVYMLSVKSANGHSFSTRFTHHGGSFNIIVMFGGNGNFLTPAPAAKAAASVTDGWVITVSAEGYIDYVQKFNPVKGRENVLQGFELKIDDGGVIEDSFTDERDDQVYGMALMPDGKVWMTENLNYQFPPPDTRTWSPDSDYRDTYGLLYSWTAAMEACPEGWHLPTREEWANLACAATVDGGGSVTGMCSNTGSTAGTRLKSKTGWTSNGTDDYGFSALPGGNNNGVNQTLANTANGYWWTATEVSNNNAYPRNINGNGTHVGDPGSTSKTQRYSVRCVRNN